MDRQKEFHMFALMKKKVAAVLRFPKQVPTSRDTWRASEPKFLLPETAEEFRRQAKALVKPSSAEVVAIEAEAARLNTEAEGLLAEEGSRGQMELNRREAIKRQERAASLLRSVRGRVSQDLQQQQNVLPWKVRQAEWEMIAHQGAIVKQTFVPADDRGLGNQTERRVVRWNDNRVFLVVLHHHAVRMVTGRETGPFGYMGRILTRDVYTPTGDYGPPQVEFVTDSPAQFTQQELEAVR
jgi:hypothetical protein